MVAVGGIVVGVGPDDVALVGDAVGAVVGAPVDDPPVGAVVVVDSWLGVELVVSGFGASVA